MTTAALTYARFETVRALRNKRYFIFSLGFPLVLFFLVAGPNRDEANLSGTGLSAPEYFMVSMASFGTMSSMLSIAGRIAGERATGWNRQLRISPLSARDYLRAKVLIGYLMACVSLAALYVAGAAIGVSLPAGQWVHMTLLILVGLIPFAALGVLLGHLVTTDTVGPVMGGGTSILALVSGTWFPIGDSGFIHDLAQLLPSYWLVQANRVVLGGDGWPGKAWVVIAVWTAILGVLAARAFRNDTARA